MGQYIAICAFFGLVCGFLLLILTTLRRIERYTRQTADSKTRVRLVIEGTPLTLEYQGQTVEELARLGESLPPLAKNGALPVKFTRLHESAKQPTYGSEYAACLDLYAAHDAELHFGCNVSIDTGIAFALPSGYEGLVRGRSGMTRKGIVTCGGTGTCDEDFRGAVGVELSWPTRPFGYSGPDVYRINAGDRIAQLAIRPIPRVQLAEVATVAELGETQRGAGGHGSTGR